MRLGYTLNDVQTDNSQSEKRVQKQLKELIRNTIPTKPVLKEYLL
jgi:hypothetical protein